MSFIGSYIGGKRGASKGLKADYHYADDDDDDGRPVLTGLLGAAIWLAIAIAVGIIGEHWLLPLILLALGWRRVIVTYLEDGDDVYIAEPRNLAPKVPVVRSKPKPEPVKPSATIRLYDGSKGPTVSVVWSTGEVVTNSFPTWREANACAENLQHDFAEDSVSVIVEIL